MQHKGILGAFQIQQSKVTTEVLLDVWKLLALLCFSSFYKFCCCAEEMQAAIH